MQIYVPFFSKYSCFGIILLRAHQLFFEAEHSPVAVGTGGEVTETVRDGGGDEGGTILFVEPTQPEFASRAQVAGV